MHYGRELHICKLRQLYECQSELHRYLLAQTVANTCRLVVDGDSVTDYLDNRRMAYYEVWNKLIDYRNTSENVLQISVVNFRDGGGCYV